MNDAVFDTDYSTDGHPEPLSLARVSEAPVVVVGAGPVGMRVLRELLNRLPDVRITLFGDETFTPYDRVRLSAVLAGQISASAIEDHGGLDDERVTFIRDRVVEIYRDIHAVRVASGAIHPYGQLVLALGSRPFIPNIPGLQLPGVFALRSMADAQQLAARQVMSRRTVVLGGGLLGIEAAKAMQRHHTQVMVVEHDAHLMFRQLDDESSGMLRDELEHRGVAVRLQTGVRMAVGVTKLEGLVLRDGESLACDTLVIATGIRPNVELAGRAGLSVGRGVRVNAHMQTNDPKIYAVGECCEIDGQLYGIVAPGLEQAAIAARSIATESGESSTFDHPVMATSVKLLDLAVSSVGEPDSTDPSVRSHVYRADGLYRRIDEKRGRVTGIVAVGDYPELIQLRESMKAGKWLPPWRFWRFRRSGELWRSDDAQIERWPRHAVVCSCNSVPKGEIVDAFAAGHRTLEAIGRETLAGTSCGSCRPHLAALMDEPAIREPTRGFKPLAVGSLALLIVALAALVAPGISYIDSASAAVNVNVLWTDGAYKQASGFTVLGLAAIGLALSLRKRYGVTAGDYAAWRLVHIVLGGSALVALAVHTGFRFGENLNAYLMVTFTLLAFAGSAMGIVLSFEHRLATSIARRARALGMWAHILLCWPLPALLGAHVFKTYYF